VKQHRVRDILVGGVTSPCWLSLNVRVFQVSGGETWKDPQGATQAVIG
jgi:hypothetical protein